MKILVIGSGGREDAIVQKLHRDAITSGTLDQLTLFAAPGNPGMAKVATLLQCAVDDLDGLLAFAKSESIELTIVGPEVPLALGIVDRFEESGLAIFGPNSHAAQLESSKAYAKAFMVKAGIPTPAYREFDDLVEALNYVDSMMPPIVVKADGLAAGKGVTVAKTVAEARQAIIVAMQERAFGDAGARVVIEQFVEGSELSVMAFVDQHGFLMMPAIQDHKQVFDHDEGPNTGGMGTFYPVPAATKQVLQKVRDEVFSRVIAEFQAQNITYRGVLFAGIIVQDGQPYVIEFNVRFGDPETQVVMELLQTDLLSLLQDVLRDRVQTHPAHFSSDPTVCVVLTCAGYPQAYKKGLLIEGLESIPLPAYVLHAGTTLDNFGHTVTDGGRVLGVVARATSLEKARDAAYRGVDHIDFEGKHYRSDIGTRM